jgi:GTPase SAR1 family protein
MASCISCIKHSRTATSGVMACFWGSKLEPAIQGCDVLVLGMEGSGKTYLIKQIQALRSERAYQDTHADTVPSYGVELTDVPCSKGGRFSSISVREVGGQMMPLWSQYYDDCRMLLYVIDSSDPLSLADAIVQLYAILREPKLQDKPICVVLSKYDLPITFKRVEIDMISRLDDLCKAQPERMSVVQLSALNGRGLPLLFDWMHKQKTKIVIQMVDSMLATK